MYGIESNLSIEKQVVSNLLAEPVGSQTSRTRLYDCEIQIHELLRLIRAQRLKAVNLHHTLLYKHEKEFLLILVFGCPDNLSVLQVTNEHIRTIIKPICNRFRSVRTAHKNRNTLAPRIWLGRADERALAE